MVSNVKEIRTCQESFVVEGAEWCLDIEGVNTRQADQSRVSGNMCIWCWLVNVQNLLLL